MAPRRVKSMNAIELLERPSEPFEVALAPDEAGNTLNSPGDCQEQAVTRKTQLDFIPQERKRPVASPVSTKTIAKRANSTMQALQKPCGQRYDGYRHWGLNE
jgi:hypothetical protein